MKPSHFVIKLIYTTVLISSIGISILFYLLEPIKIINDIYALQMLTYLIVFIGIPWIYYLKQSFIKKNESIGNNTLSIKEYSLIWGLLEMLVMYNVVAYFFSGNKNILFTWAICILFFMLNQPRYLFKEVVSESDPEENNNQSEG